MRQLIVLGLGLALLAGCASTDAAPEPEVAELDPATDDEAPEDDDPTEAEAPTDDEPDEAAGAGDTEVSIGDFFFDPGTTSVTVGETVTWTHEGDITHTVTARNDSFASDNLADGDTFSHTFDTAGSFEYRCTLHGQMVATVEVS